MTRFSKTASRSVWERRPRAYLWCAAREHGHPGRSVRTVGFIINYRHPSRTMVFAAIGTLAVAGGFAVAGLTADRGRIGLLISSGHFFAIGLHWVFAAIWFKIRGNPFG